VVTGRIASLVSYRRLPSLRLVWVRGPSMVPTLTDGDVVVVLINGKVRRGDVVLARFRSMPQRWVLKRAERCDGDGWLLASDNPFAGGDSATHGLADVSGRVLLRVHGRRISRPRRVI